MEPALVDACLDMRILVLYDALNASSLSAACWPVDMRLHSAFRLQSLRSIDLDKTSILAAMLSYKRFIKKVLNRYGFVLVRRDALERMIVDSETQRNLEWIAGLPESAVGQLLGACRNSKAQLKQDLFVLSELGLKRNGFFVEFGAADGIALSNTYVLEREFGWRGIVAEPARRWHATLRKNRTCSIESDCVWRETGRSIVFNEVDEGEYSAIDSYSSVDFHRARREHGTKYEVRTISLEDLLDKYDAPQTIDYLSIDTEGSEYDILSNFNFDRHQFRIITCEHNFEAQREKIENLLARYGYAAKYRNLSEYDDWYVNTKLK